MISHMKTTLILGTSLLALAGCAQQVPNSGEGVGFNDYAQYEVERARREASLQGSPGPTVAQNAAPSQSASITPPRTDGVSSSELAAAGINVAVQTAPDRTTFEQPMADGTAFDQTTPDQSAPAAALASNPRISDEQNFEAVASRESIESDADRRDRQSAAYELIEATALPDRPGDAGPNIVQYALQAPNNRGEQVFSRNGIFAQSRYSRNCAQYRTPDDAQRDFLSRGGPQRDRLGVDPDGDGFACGWDPQPFRSVASGN